MSISDGDLQDLVARVENLWLSVGPHLTGADELVIRLSHRAVRISCESLDLSHLKRYPEPTTEKE